MAGKAKMHIGEKLRELRESKDLSQGEIEKRSGVLRVYVSRVENGHTVPAIETLEKLARALEVPMYQLFYEGEEPPKVLAFPKDRLGGNTEWGSSGKDARYLHKLRRFTHFANRYSCLCSGSYGGTMFLSVVGLFARYHWS